MLERDPKNPTKYLEIWTLGSKWKFKIIVTDCLNNNVCQDFGGQIGSCLFKGTSNAFIIVQEMVDSSSQDRKGHFVENLKGRN